jgi:hypothetical protein
LLKSKISTRGYFGKPLIINGFYKVPKSDFLQRLLIVPLGVVPVGDVGHQIGQFAQVRQAEETRIAKRSLGFFQRPRL